MGGLKINVFLLSSFGIGLKGSILNILLRTWELGGGGVDPEQGGDGLGGGGGRAVTIKDLSKLFFLLIFDDE